MDSQKIKQVYFLAKERPKICEIIETVKEGGKSKADLAALYLMDGDYETAAAAFLKANDHKAAFNCLMHLPLTLSRS